MRLFLHRFCILPAALLSAALFLTAPGMAESWPTKSSPVESSPEVIDRIVATVNGRVILQSDLDEALCYEALLSGHPTSELAEEDRRAVLDRLIDQELLRGQMKSAEFQHATEAEVEARVADARKQYPQASAEEGWIQLLAQYQMTEKDLKARVQQQIDVMRLVDARLRPAVQIDSKSIEAYYREQFAPQLNASDAGRVPLEQVSGKIRELLTEQKVSEMLVSWLQTLRSQGDVRIPGSSPSPDQAVRAQ
jgi:hypothetical protein